jgi:hypothetical protein
MKIRNPKRHPAVNLLNALAVDNVGGFVDRVLNPLDIGDFDTAMATDRVATCPSDQPGTFGSYSKRAFLCSRRTDWLDLTAAAPGLRGVGFRYVARG